MAKKTFKSKIEYDLVFRQAALGPNLDRSDVQSMALVELFKPQPLLCEFERRVATTLKMENFIVGPRAYNGALPKESVNRDPWKGYDRREHFLKILLINLSSHLNLFVWRFPGASDREMQINAEKVIDAMLGIPPRQWFSAPESEKHESRTFSFFIPTNVGRAQRISFDLKVAAI